ncbi:TetR/AcrR family transcriptional regulator [Streptomyces pactum]|uniref:TetR/AcrR family transcriptional regulator n=1 Tax=Streptomyces pactum TaxID=68249 RepID=UPI0035588F13
MEVFLREGYQRASVDTIADAARVSKQTVYNHFGDKERLFIAAVEGERRRVAEAFTPAPHTRTRPRPGSGPGPEPGPGPGTPDPAPRSGRDPGPEPARTPRPPPRPPPVSPPT